jgi:hypothetical protein
MDGEKKCSSRGHANRRLAAGDKADIKPGAQIIIFAAAK